MQVDHFNCSRPGAAALDTATLASESPAQDPACNQKNIHITPPFSGNALKITLAPRQGQRKAISPSRRPALARASMDFQPRHQDSGPDAVTPCRFDAAEPRFGA